MARQPEALRTREHRELFERAVSENVTMEEARRRQAAERWARMDAKLALKRSAPLQDENEERVPRFWWHRG